MTLSYAAAGVDIAAAEANVRSIGEQVRSTHGPSVLGDFGAFAGLFHLRDVRDPVLVASTDGVGSKVLLGLQLGRYDVLGRDLVNLSVDDVLTTGARPLFFLDYVGLHAIEQSTMDALVAGMAAACRENGCALLGGETSQLPGHLRPGAHGPGRHGRRRRGTRAASSTGPESYLVTASGGWRRQACTPTATAWRGGLSPG